MLRREKALLIAVTIFALLVRIYRITSSPEGLYIDETSIGYNAYSLLSTGKDEHGKSWPLFFEAFGEYKLPVYIYAVVAVQVFTGPTDLSVRLPAVVFGTFTTPLFYLWLRQMFPAKDNERGWKYVAAAGSILLTISPWHYLFSRPGHEATIALFFLVLGLYAFFKGIRQQSWVALAVAFVSFTLMLYSYNSARIVMPMIMAVLILLFYPNIGFARLTALIPVFILAWPFIEFARSPQGLVRAQQVSIFFEKNPRVWETFLANYWVNSSPWTLFFAGDIYDKAPHMMGLLHLVELPFFFAGFALLVGEIVQLGKWWKEAAVLVCIALIGFVPAAASTPNPLALRSLLALPGLLAFSAIGISAAFKRLPKKYWTIAVAVLFLAFSLSMKGFLKNYHNGYVVTAGERIWQVSKKQALLFAKEKSARYEEIYLAPELREINAAWYIGFLPREFQRRSFVDSQGKKYYFVSSALMVPATSTKKLYVTAEPQVPGAQLLTTIYTPKEYPAYTVWEVN